ncbi:MAG: aminopeptidase N [Marinagarivorans sp.]|nr:aminopeptidase N [Marinagarivorans sp.]
MNTSTEAQTISTTYLKDYTPPAYLIEQTNLTFKLHPLKTEVTSTLLMVANPSAEPTHKVFLNGQDLTLISITLDGKILSPKDYELTADGVWLLSVPARFSVTIVNEIAPEKNTSLEGLYKSRTMYCTQCEAEGFRKITYYLDRPDVLSTFTTTVIGDKKQFPVLLSNGNNIKSGDLEGGLHFATWHDPFKKPAYLFALVAGDLEHVEDNFKTCSGRDVKLQIFVEPKDLDKCDHAMQSLKNSMKWDEEVYGREYDLDIFMIVAVDDFNMGAMENKGLNIFNTSCVLANPKTTTDAGFGRVEGVVAHEYFHNWSGNRVTCRDWFQLSLKEGFTVFRDAEFSADMGSRTVTRVGNVNMLRTAQFAEDAGPMSHPVQPASYMEISNFYTMTIYEKGAEVVRMYHTLLGPDLFRKGTDIYFEKNDGQAATIEDFIAAMTEASGRDFSQFKYWYTQAGTPVVQASGQYNAYAKTFSLSFKQFCRDTPEAKGSDKKPFHIPVDVSLLSEQGAINLQLNGKGEGDQTVLELTEAEQTFIFEGVEQEPVPVLFRGFSAPVKCAYPYKKADLLRIATLEADGFARFDAMQQLAVIAIFDVMAALRKKEAWTLEPLLLKAVQNLLQAHLNSSRDWPNAATVDPAMVALMCQLPSEAYLSGLAEPVEVDLIYQAREQVKQTLAAHCRDIWLKVYQSCMSSDAYAYNANDVAKRSLKNTALDYLMAEPTPEIAQLCYQQYTQADNMTDQAASLAALVHSDSAQVTQLQKQALADFYQQFKHESLVVNLWLSIQASNPAAGALARVKALMAHPAYEASNPNKIRSVVGVFCNNNAVNFHALDGSGYNFLADQIIDLNAKNPQIASRLLAPLTKWRKYDVNRQILMKAALERIKQTPALSSDVFEVVLKSL